MPRPDVRITALVPGGPAGVAWTYESPAAAILPVGGLVALLDEAVDVVLDGVAQQRPEPTFSR